MSLVDKIQIILGGLSIVTTILVAFIIYWLQVRQEKQRKRIGEKQEYRKLEENSKLFLLDNEAEQDYLPWCFFAANIHRLKKHHRKIYTSFCRCSEELQNEILKQAGFEINPIKGREWVNECLEELKKDIEKYNLGRNYLYDGAKYFHRSYERYRDLKWDNTPRLFEPIYENNQFSKTFRIDKLDIGSYIDEYFCYLTNKGNDLIENEPVPPIDYVWSSKNLTNADEELVCMWMMELIQNIAIIIGNKDKDKEDINEKILGYTDAEAETFEDKYYEVLHSLYNTYYVNSNKMGANMRRRRWHIKRNHNI